MSTNDFDLSLAPETIQEFANASDRNLTAPNIEANPHFRRGKEEGLGTWPEKVRIRDTSIDPTKKDPTNTNKLNFVAVLEVIGASDGGFATNAGRVHYYYGYIDKTELASNDPKVSGVYKRRLSVVNSLLGACGVDLTQGISSYKEWFLGEKPLVGQTAVAIIRKYRNKNTGDTGVDVDGFTATE